MAVINNIQIVYQFKSFPFKLSLICNSFWKTNWVFRFGSFIFESMWTRNQYSKAIVIGRTRSTKFNNAWHSQAPLSNRKMFKFTVLKYNKFVLTHLGILSEQLPSETCTRSDFFKRPSSYYILLTMTALVVASVMFVLQNVSQFDVALRTCAIAIGTSQSIGMYFCFGINLRKINALHLKLQAIIDEVVNGKAISKMCAPINKNAFLTFFISISRW